MRFPFSLFVLALVCGVSQAAPVRKIVPKGAVSFTSNAQGFSIWFPAIPKQTKTTFPKGSGFFGVNTFVVGQKPPSSLSYAVFVNPTPKPFRANRKGLDYALKGFLKSGQLKLQTREEIQLEGFPGREVKLLFKDGRTTSRGRIYSTPRFFYRVIINGFTADMKIQNAQITRVFDSFRILPQKWKTPRLEKRGVF